MLSASLALLLQLSVVGAPAPVTDEALAVFARNESPLGFWLAETITSDPAMHAEMRRVGFATACNVLAESRNSVAMRYRERLVPATVKSVRDTVPADRLEEMKILSFLVGPMQIYKARILVPRVSPITISQAPTLMRRATGVQNIVLIST